MGHPRSVAYPRAASTHRACPGAIRVKCAHMHDPKRILDFPSLLNARDLGGYPTLDLTVTDVKPNAPASIQANGGAPQNPPTTSMKLADGVFAILYVAYLAGL